MPPRLPFPTTHLVSACPTGARTYATRYPRPKPGQAHRPPPRHPDPLLDNPNAVVTRLDDEGLTFIHRPPPTSPSPFSSTEYPASPLLRPKTATPILSSEGSALALPPISRPALAKPRPPTPASAQTIAEIRRLRSLDPAKYTRGYLAGKFGVTQHFVGLVAALKKPLRKRVVGEREEMHRGVREGWSEGMGVVRAVRRRRREFW